MHRVGPQDAFYIKNIPRVELFRYSHSLDAKRFEPAFAVKQRHIYPARVRRVAVDDFIIEFFERRAVLQAPQHEAVLHLGEGADIGRGAAVVRCGKYRFGDAVCLMGEPLPVPVFFAPGGKLVVERDRIVERVEKVLQVPKEEDG